MNMDQYIFYANRSPTPEDWQHIPESAIVWINEVTEQSFFKTHKGWLFVPTKYECEHGSKK